MADVASTLRSWSSTASSNQPQGGTTIGSGLDDNIRQLQAVVRQFLADQSTTVVPSAGVADLTGSTGRWVPVSGNSTITGFGTESAGIWYLVTLTGSPPIVNGNISTPGAVTIVGSAGDMFVADSQGGGIWRIHSYTRSGGGAWSRPRTRTVLTSGSGTYSTPAGCSTINVRMVGGGGGGGGRDANSGSNGGDTSFGALSANGGVGGSSAFNSGGAGGSASGGDINLTGGGGGGGAQGTTSVGMCGGPGGNSAFGGGGKGTFNTTGGAGATNTGGGGAGGGGTTAQDAGAGGGAGGYCEKLIVSPSSSYSYAVGAAGSGGAAGGTAGGDGGSGVIIIDEYYN